MLSNSALKLLDTIDTYYELVDKRIPGHGENVAELHKRKILIDGKAGELLLQIFSENQLGPIFFEFIQRKGDQGFGFVPNDGLRSIEHFCLHFFATVCG